MLIIALIVFGVLVGGIAQLLLGRSMNDISWGPAIVCGLVGSFVGGLVLSLLFGDGIQLQPSGLIGSVLGALVVTVLWERFGPARS